MPLYDKLEIGDVGFILDGQFYRLFSAGRSPEVGEEVPPGFSVLTTGVVRELQPLAAGAFTSQQIRLVKGKVKGSLCV